jgi:hypothetical protein
MSFKLNFESSFNCFVELRTLHIITGHDALHSRSGSAAAEEDADPVETPHLTTFLSAQGGGGGESPDVTFTNVPRRAA